MPSVDTFRRWAIKYENGNYDGFLCSMGFVRKSSIIRPTHGAIKRKVLDQLLLNDFATLLSISNTEVNEILVSVEASMGIDHIKRSQTWINRMKLIAQKTKIKELMETVIADNVETGTETDLVGEFDHDGFGGGCLDEAVGFYVRRRLQSGGSAQ